MGVKVSGINSWSEGEGCHVANFVFLKIVVEVAVDPCAVEVVGGDREAGGDEQVFSSSRGSFPEAGGEGAPQS